MSWRRLARKLGPVGLLGLLWIAFPSVLGILMVARLGVLADLLSHERLLSLPLWTLLMALCIGVGLLPVYANTFLCGWAFGWGWGWISSVGSYLMAAVLGYHIAHRLSFGRVNALIEESDAASRLRQVLLHDDRRRALLIVSLWRLSGSPFPLTNLMMASCGVPMRIYLFGTLLGLGPRVAVGTLLAFSAARTGAHDLQTLVRNSEHPVFLAIGFLATLLTLGLIGQAARRTIRRVAKEP